MVTAVSPASLKNLQLRMHRALRLLEAHRENDDIIAGKWDIAVIDNFAFATLVACEVHSMATMLSLFRTQQSLNRSIGRGLRWFRKSSQQAKLPTLIFLSNIFAANAKSVAREMYEYVAPGAVHSARHSTQSIISNPPSFWALEFAYLVCRTKLD